MVILKTNKDFYSNLEASKYSMTVRELINELENLHMDDKVVFSNDGGYTYGNITSDSIKIIR